MRRLFTLALIVLAAVLAVVAFRDRHGRQDAEEQLGLASARVLTARFRATDSLRVAQLSGQVLAKAEDRKGCYGLCPAEQRTIAPYSVDYTVDLDRLDERALRWNAKARIMTVDLPVVEVSQPNVDMAHAKTSQNGAWISRRAGRDMQTGAATNLASAAAAKARSPENLRQADDAARAAVERNLTAPLRAAGLGDVRVVIRLATERKPAALTTEQWDRSRLLEEVLGGQR